MLGKRKVTKASGPHNMTYVFLGTALLWYGWFGFNGGSSLSSTARASMAAFVTTLAASCGGLAWTFLDYFKHRKISGLAFCSGAVAGLVVITPAAGYVALWASIIIGLLAGIGCNLGCRFKQLFGFDDSLDAFGIHGVGGVLGCILAGVFAQGSIGHLDDAIFSVGWVDGNFIQVPYQIAAACAAAAWSFVISIILLYIINKIPGLHLRHSKEVEDDGADKTEMGESAYDYIRRSNLKIHDSSQAVNIQIQ
jgi:Amt family ammonium transporter